MFGFFTRNALCQTMAGVTDGLSNSIMVGETLPADCVWMNAYNHNFPMSSTTIPVNLINLVNTNAYGFTGLNPGTQYYVLCGWKSRHPGGANFLFGDGSTRFVKASINYLTYNQIGSVAGGEVVSADSY